MSVKPSERVKAAEEAGLSLKDFMKGKKRWISLHGHSEFSLLDGAAKVEDIIRKAKAMGQDAIAITDHGNLFGAVKAAKAAKEAGIKYIVGCELYLAPMEHSRFFKDYKRGERPYTHLVVLAKNKAGYQNLAILSSLGFQDGFYRVPRIDHEILAQHKEGLIVTSSCVGGAIPTAVLDGDFYKAEKELEWFLKHFGDDFYVELQDHDTEVEDRAFTYMRELAQKYDIPTIVTTDAHYLDKEDAMAHDCLLCIGTGDWVDNPDRRFKFEGDGFHYMSEEEVLERFPHDVDAIYRTGEVADKIEDEVIEFGEVKLPYFVVGEDPEFDEWRAKRGYSKWVTL